MGGFMRHSSIAALALVLSVAASGVTSEEATTAGQTRATPRSSAPELPRRSVDVGPVPTGQRTIHVAAGQSLQRAIDRAEAGDAITLDAGAEYRGPFHLPRKAGDGWIVIRSATADRDLPAVGRTVQRHHTSRMPKLVSRTGPVIAAGAGAHHYRLVGLEIAPASGVFLHALVDLGSNAADLTSVPHDFIIDRCYLRGDPKRGTRRGVALNSRNTAIVESLFLDFKEAGADSQAIAGWNGPGPFLIANNHLEAAGENVMFGGADPHIDELVPADIEIMRNRLAKSFRWKQDDRRFEGTAWTVKNLLELKNARRVLIDGNLLQYNWPESQNGFAVLFTVRNQDGRAPWSVVEDVTFRGNVVRHAGGGINILGHDDNHPSRQTSRIAIVDNVFADIGGPWGHGRLFQVLDGTRDVVIDHNTAFQTGTPIFGGDSRAHTGFVFRNNIVRAGANAITGSGTAPGAATITRYFPGAAIQRNVFIGAAPAQIPPDNFVARRVDDVGVAPSAPGEPFASLAPRFAGVATDGRDPGAASHAITAVLAAGISGLAELPSPVAARLRGATPAEVGFWSSLAILGYVCLGYPILARLRAAISPRTRRREPIEPRVTVIVAAHNEADRIERRLRNLLALDYPADKLEIIVGSDGSTDDTALRAGTFTAAGVVVCAFGTRRGKPAMFNRLVPHASGEIIVFADARQRFDPRAIRALVANFADAAVGAVSGELVMRATDEAEIGGEGAAMYWSYEKLIRSNESRGGSTVGATGAIYAIRKALFEPLPEDTILDDVLIPVRIARQGYHVVFEPAAKAFDVAPANARAELARKARTIGGTFQLFARERWLLNPRVNPLWFETISHKALRLAIPLLLATMLVTNLILIEVWPYQLTMAGQAAFYAAAAMGCLHRRTSRTGMLLKLPYTMCLLSWATVIGFVRFVTDDQEVTWERAMSPRIH
jgi:cellulose synthase/poly-beta-1,6-N-acetylglucosamine synthase-like glycosyltransferase